MQAFFWRAVCFSSTALVLGCSNDATLPDTVVFPPGTEILYQSQPAKIYGSSQCEQYGLTGHTCLIFSPQSAEATATILRGSQVESVRLKALRDPDDPTRFMVIDSAGQRVLRTSATSPAPTVRLIP